MRVNSIDQLATYIENEYGNRRREIFLLISVAEKADIPSREAVIRSTITILYAHWEGFVKESAIAFLTHIESKRLKNSEIKKCFLAISLIPMINSTYNELTLENLLKIVDKFQDSNSRWKVTIRKTVDMESNLSSKVFKKLIKNLGFDYSKFELKEKLIDEKLLNKRNIIAHGGYEKVDIEQLKEIYTIIISVMEDFKDQIYDCVRDKKYLKSSNS